jgi:hypothetical protein
MTGHASGDDTYTQVGPCSSQIASRAVHDPHFYKAE